MKNNNLTYTSIVIGGKTIVSDFIVRDINNKINKPSVKSIYSFYHDKKDDGGIGVLIRK